MSKAISSDTTPMAFLSVTDRQRAKTFYCDVLGLNVIHEDDFALVLKIGSISLRIAEVPDLKPLSATVLGWQVEDIQASVASLIASGIEGKRYPWMEQNEQGLWQPPGSQMWIFWFEDPDGNLLSLSS